MKMASPVSFFMTAMKHTHDTFDAPGFEDKEHCIQTKKMVERSGNRMVRNPMDS